MSAKKAKKTDVRREAIGIFMQVLWFLLLISLLTYSWKDIRWLNTPANDPVLNSIGPTGAYMAFVVFMFFGVAGYLLPLLIAAWGILLITQSTERLWPRVVWMFGILTAVSILVDMNSGFWVELTRNRLNLTTANDVPLLEGLNITNLPGGFVGYVLGTLFLTRFLGPVGAGLICTGTIISGLFFVSRTHPVMLLKWLQNVREVWQERREERLTAREERRALRDKEDLQTARERERAARAELKELRQREKEMARAAKEAEKAEAKRLAQAEREARQAEREARLAERQQAAEEKEAEKQARREAILQRIAEQQAAEKEREAAERRAAEERRAAAEAEKNQKAKALKDAARKRRTENEEADAEERAAAPAHHQTTAWKLPPLSLLQPIPEEAAHRRPEDVQETIEILKRTLNEFNVEAEVTHVEQGPVVTRYELLPAPGIPVQRFHALSGNITLALKAEGIRVQAPVPGKGVVGIEVPNHKPAPVVLRELIESSVWATSRAALPLALGVDVGGRVLVNDLAALPHLLIAGATGQGKTVCMNSLLAGLLLTRTPDELRLILVDPKIVEFSGYNGLPHLQFPVVTESKRVISALRWAILEMQRRFQRFAQYGVRDIKGYNQRIQAILDDAAQNEADEIEDEVEGILDEVEASAMDEALAEAEEMQNAEEEAEPALPEKLPYIVIIIDELADLMLSESQEIEPQIQKLTQLARATGIHMVIATQRPTVNIITGTIKSNIPGRVAFKVAQKNDSRVVIDQEGADKLVGKGDMLVLMGANKITRAQGAWTKDEEIQAIAEYWKAQGKPHFTANLGPEKAAYGKTPATATTSELPGFSGLDADGFPDMPDEDDELLQKALDVIRATQRASTSSIQRRLRIGYTRAARIMDILEEKGYIGPPRGSEPREILFDMDSTNFREEG